MKLLGDIDDAAVVVVAGNLFIRNQPRTSSGSLTRRWQHYPRCVKRSPPSRQILGTVSSCCRERGSRTEVQSGRARSTRATRGRLRERSDPERGHGQWRTRPGGRRGACTIDTARADVDDRADADRLEDPHALPRFVASRVLYRRLGGWVWFPVIALLLFDFLTSLNAIVYHFTRHHIRVHTLTPAASGTTSCSTSS